MRGDGEVFLGANNLTVSRNTDGFSYVPFFSGVIQDGGLSNGVGGSLTKAGSRTLILTGASTYTGGTTVNAGALLANNASGSGAGSGAVTASNARTLFGGTGTISGPVTMNAGTALIAGNGRTPTGSLTLSNNLALNPGSIIQFALGPSGTHSTLSRAGGTWTFASNQAIAFTNVGAHPGFYDNVITGLAGDPGGEAFWTIITAGFAGSFAYDGAGNIDLNLTTASFIDFEEAPSQDGVYGPSHLTPQGFLFRNFNAPYNGGQPTDVRIRDPNLSHPGSFTTKEIGNSQLDGTTLMTENTGAVFSITSLDVGSSFPRTITFTGTKYDGSVVTQSVNTSGEGYKYTHVDFSGFTNLASFKWGQHTNYVDNIVAPIGPEALVLRTATSRKTHPDAGTFDVNLPLTGPPGVECRDSDGSHALVFTFNNTPVNGNASLTSGTGTVSGTPVFDVHTMTVNLTGVADVQKITLKLSNVTDNFGQVLPDTSVSVNLLVGDTTGNKSVNSSDIAQTKAQSGATVTGANFRTDLTVSGSINASDIALAKSRSGFGVP